MDKGFHFIVGYIHCHIPVIIGIGRPISQPLRFTRLFFYRLFDEGNIGITDPHGIELVVYLVDIDIDSFPFWRNDGKPDTTFCNANLE